MNFKTKGLFCTEKECKQPVYARLLCQKHYNLRRLAQRAVSTPPNLRQNYRRGDPCRVEECPDISIGRGYCKLHYQRWRKFGDPFVLRKPLAPQVAIPEGISSPTKLAKVLGVSRQRAHQLLHKEAHNANCAVRVALKTGALTKPELCDRCDKPSTDLEAHHWDYSLPLDVRWLCVACHANIHAAKRKGKKKKANDTRTQWWPNT